MKIGKIINVGGILVIAALFLFPTSISAYDGDDVELVITGGFGYHVTAINHRAEGDIMANVTIERIGLIAYPIENTTMIISAGVGITLDRVTIRPCMRIQVTIESCGTTLERKGIIIMGFTLFYTLDEY